MKAAAIAIEYGLPRLAVTASIHGGDFADQLERALKQSSQILKRWLKANRQQTQR
jgi:hypothetical protein